MIHPYCQQCLQVIYSDKTNLTNDKQIAHVNEYPTMHHFGIPRHSVNDSIEPALPACIQFVSALHGSLDVWQADRSVYSGGGEFESDWQ